LSFTPEALMLGPAIFIETRHLSICGSAFQTIIFVKTPRLDNVTWVNSRCFFPAGIQ
jgi:hypothetical protein